MADTHSATRTPGQTQQPRSGAGGGDGGQGKHETQGGVGDTLRHAASGVADVAGQVKDRVQDAASSVAHRAEEAWDSASSGVRRGADFVSETAGNFWDDTTTLIRRYPVASVMIAFGLGCLTASMFRVPNWSDDVARRMSRGSA